MIKWISPTKSVANDDFSEPPRCAGANNPIFVFCRFLGPGHLRGPGVSLGRIRGGGGGSSIEPFLGEGRSSQRAVSTPAPPPPRYMEVGVVPCTLLDPTPWALPPHTPSHPHSPPLALHDPPRPPTTPAYTHGRSRQDNQALVVVGQQHVGIAFRGTVNQNNVLTDLKFFTQPYEEMRHAAKGKCCGFFTFPRVHIGFYDAWRRVREPTLQKLQRVLQKEAAAGHDRKRLYVSGHSLGGAIATLAAYEILLLYPDLDVTLYTFGSPRVGNAVCCPAASCPLRDAPARRAGQGCDPRPHDRTPAPTPAMQWKGGRYPPSPSRAPSLCPAAVSLTPSASLNGIYNRQ